MQLHTQNTEIKDISKLGLMTMSAMEGASTESQDNDKITIDSRFGEVNVDLEHAISFPQGLLGLPDNLHFCITDIPKENMGQFKLLQCLNDHSLSFVVLPLDVDNILIDKEDIIDCAKQVNINPDDLAILLIVSVQRSPDGVKVIANVRAPILIDVDDQAAIQFVFSSSKYNICHQLV